MVAVVMTYNFTDESSVYIFEDEEYAKNFLYSVYCKERETERDENGYEIDSMVSVDRTYAVISHSGVDEDGEEFEDVCEYRLCYDVNFIGKPSKFVN